MANPIADPFAEVPDTDTQTSLPRIDATPEGAARITVGRADKKNAFSAEVIAPLRESSGRPKA